MNHTFKFISVIIIITGLFTSCVDNFNSNKETVYYNPSFSLPIGPLSYSLDEIMPKAALGLPIPDSIMWTDSVLIPLIIYDDSLFFPTPEDGYNTIFIEPIDFQSLTNQWEHIRSLMFRVNYANGLPVNVATQLYFLNDGNLIIDSLYLEGKTWIQSASLDGNGIVEVPFLTTTDTPIDSARIDHIIAASQLQIYLFLETYNESIDTLRVYSNYHFDLQLGVRAELMVPL
jgi:hypothetical protein